MLGVPNKVRYTGVRYIEVYMYRIYAYCEYQYILTYIRGASISNIFNVWETCAVWSSGAIIKVLKKKGMSYVSGKSIAMAASLLWMALLLPTADCELSSQRTLSTTQLIASVFFFLQQNILEHMFLKL